MAKFVVKDEQVFKVVEGDGFRELVQELQPMFVVPSRVTIARDVHHLYFKERVKLMEVLTTTGQRVCLTSDCWTSRTQMSYMCLTAHYVDSDWKLQKKIINFCQISNHKGDTIGKAIEVWKEGKCMEGKCMEGGCSWWRGYAYEVWSSYCEFDCK